jgi:hypothetical protein
MSVSAAAIKRLCMFLRASDFERRRLQIRHGVAQIDKATKLVALFFPGARVYQFC